MIARPSYFYQDPSNSVDRIRSEEAGKLKRKQERDDKEGTLAKELRLWREERRAKNVK